MTAALDMPTQGVFNTPSRSRAAWLMLVGFPIYTLLILLGHLVGFPLGYAYLHTICPKGCSLTPGNVHALEQMGLSIPFYAYLYMAIQVLSILICVGIALLIVVKKPGQWVSLGMSAFLVGLSAYEGADYPALAAAYPVLYAPTQLLIGLGMGLLGMYALLTFPNGTFGSRWVLGFYLVNGLAVVLFAFLTTPVFVLLNTVYSLLSFPMIVGILIYRSRRLLNPKERAATRWIIVSVSLFLLIIFLVFLLVPALAPADSLALLLVNIAGFFGCGINIAGFLMAVLYANACDIDVFVRRTLVYTLLTATLAVVYIGLVRALAVCLRDLQLAGGAVSAHPGRLDPDHLRPLPAAAPSHSAHHRPAVLSQPLARTCARRWTWTSCASSCWRWCRRRCSRRTSRYGCALLNHPGNGKNDRRPRIDEEEQGEP